MYEHHKEPLLPFGHFLKRLLSSFLLALGFITISLIIGAAGYHATEKLPWIDSFLNASMILTGMGPVDAMKTTSGKLFATFYSLYSGIAFLTIAALILTPVIHRFLHRFHLENEK